MDAEKGVLRGARQFVDSVGGRHGKEVFEDGDPLFDGHRWLSGRVAELDDLGELVVSQGDSSFLRLLSIKASPLLDRVLWESEL